MYVCMYVVLVLLLKKSSYKRRIGFYFGFFQDFFSYGGARGGKTK
jgi:hypothetical protein